MSQATTPTATRYKNILDARGAPPPSPLDTVRGENGSGDEQDSDSTRPRSQKHKLKRRSTTSGSREHSISREALSGSIRRLSGSTSRSSEHSRGDMFWENGGTAEEISAAAMRKERKHRDKEQREREKEQRNREETEQRNKDERERDRDRRDRDRRDERREEKREKKHHRNKSERERARTEKKREGLKSGGISIITTTDNNLQHAIRIPDTPQSSFHPMAVEIPPPPPPQPAHPPPPPPPSHAYSEVRRRESQTISPPPPAPAPAPPPNQIAPPSPPQSASSDHQSTPPPPAYAEMKLRENAPAITPPQSPPDEKKPALRSKAPSPVNTTITTTSSSMAATQPIPQAPASKAARRSLPPSPVAEKKKPEPQQQQLQQSNTQPPAYQQHQSQPQRPPSSAQSNASTGTVRLASLAPSKPVVAPIHTEQPQTRQRSPPVRISDPPPPALQPSARISDPPPQPARISPAPTTRISDPIPTPPPQSEQPGPVPKRPRSSSPIESVAPEEDSISPLVQAQPKRDYPPDYAMPQSAGPWSKPPSFQTKPRTRAKRPHSFAVAPYGSIEEDTLPTPRGGSHHIPRRASISNPYPPQPYYQDHSGYGYTPQLPPPAYPTYDWNDPYAPSAAYAPPPPPPPPPLPRMEYESGYSHHQSRSDSFHYMGASPPPAPKPQPVPKLELVQANVNRTGRRRRKSSPAEAAAGRSNREYYEGAMTKVSGEEIESDIDLEGGFYSDGSAGGWTTMSVSRERTHSPAKKTEEETVEDVDDRDLREEHRERMRKEKMKHQPEPQPQPQQEPEEEKAQPPPKPRVHVPKSIVTVSESAVSSPSESQSSSEEEEPEPWAVPQPEETSYPPANTGYPLVAKTIAESPNLQVYRRFSTLNHRVLLHMQDDISELSSRLDALDAQAESAVKNRRGMARTPLGERRLQILVEVGWKIGQYNQAVKAYQDTLSIPPATSADIASFRTWLAEYDPLVPEESTFLDEESDLMSLGRPSSPPPPPAPTPTCTPPPAPPAKLDASINATDLDRTATVDSDSNTIPTTPAAKPFSPPVLSTSSLQGLTIAAILLAPMMQADAPACACNNAVKTFNWGGFLLRSVMWVLALTPAGVSLIDRRGWWAFALVVLGVGGGLTLLSMT